MELPRFRAPRFEACFTSFFLTIGLSVPGFAFFGRPPLLAGRRAFRTKLKTVTEVGPSPMAAPSSRPRGPRLRSGQAPFRVERSSLHDKRLIVGRRSLRSALRAPVETTGAAIGDRPIR
jgi:hypothetical protein